MHDGGRGGVEAAGPTAGRTVRYLFPRFPVVSSRVRNECVRMSNAYVRRFLSVFFVHVAASDFASGCSDSG